MGNLTCLAAASFGPSKAARKKSGKGVRKRPFPGSGTDGLFDGPTTGGRPGRRLSLFCGRANLYRCFVCHNSLTYIGSRAEIVSEGRFIQLQSLSGKMEGRTVKKIGPVMRVRCRLRGCENGPGSGAVPGQMDMGESFVALGIANVRIRRKTD